MWTGGRLIWNWIIDVLRGDYFILFRLSISFNFFSLIFLLITVDYLLEVVCVAVLVFLMPFIWMWKYVSKDYEGFREC